MKIGLRIFLGYFLIVGLAGFFVMRVFVDEMNAGGMIPVSLIRWEMTGLR